MTGTPSLSAQDSLVALMIAVSAADENIRTAELVQISGIVDNLPVFADYDADMLPVVSRAVFDLLEQEDGLDALFGLIRAALPERLFRTVISWEPLMSVRAAKYKKRIAEVPAGEPPRIGGERKLQVLRWGAAYYFQFWRERFCA